MKTPRMDSRFLPLLGVALGVLAGTLVGVGAASAYHGGAMWTINCGINPCTGTPQWDDIYGTNTYNDIRAHAGIDMAFANDGGDDVDMGPNSDHAVGQNGPDDIKGAEGDDVFFVVGVGTVGLEGASGKDQINGGVDDDNLYGDGDDDVLTGGYGNDYLNGGPGNDTCNGGGGNDQKLSCEN